MSIKLGSIYPYLHISNCMQEIQNLYCWKHYRWLDQIFLFRNINWDLFFQNIWIKNPWKCATTEYANKPLDSVYAGLSKLVLMLYSCVMKFLNSFDYTHCYHITESHLLLYALSIIIFFLQQSFFLFSKKLQNAHYVAGSHQVICLQCANRSFLHETNAVCSFAPKYLLT